MSARNAEPRCAECATPDYLPCPHRPSRWIREQEADGDGLAPDVCQMCGVPAEDPCACTDPQGEDG